MLAIAGLVALLVLLPTRRLHLAGWRREALTTYFASVLLRRTGVVAVASTARGPSGPPPPGRLRPDVTFLTHGSSGACPAPVLDRQRELADELEAGPVSVLATTFEDPPA